MAHKGFDLCFWEFLLCSSHRTVFPDQTPDPLSCIHIYIFRHLCIQGVVSVFLCTFSHTCVSHQVSPSITAVDRVCISLPTVPGFRLYVATVPSVELGAACSALIPAAGHSAAHLFFLLTFLCILSLPMGVTSQKAGVRITDRVVFFFFFSSPEAALRYGLDMWGKRAEAARQDKAGARSQLYLRQTPKRWLRHFLSTTGSLLIAAWRIQTWVLYESVNRVL